MTNHISRYYFFFLTLLFFTSFSADAQYYYKDILSNLQLNKEFSILKNAKIKTIKLQSFEDDDQPSEGFFCEKKIKKNYLQSEMISKSYITGQSLLTTDYNPEGKIIKTINSTPTATNIVQYEYNNQGQLSMLRMITTSDADSTIDSTSITETHEYSYDQDGKLDKMFRKKNGILISTITFIKDDKGNIIEEDATGNSDDKKYYYYYDEQNRLTDVVHFNERAQKLLPDYMFEYNELNLPKQMISIDETASNYFIWKYAYDDKQLPEIQKCFSKEKRLLGSIQYEYH